MASIWVESLERSFDTALETLAAAVRDCTDDQWEAPMWQTPPLPPEHQFLDPNWIPVTDAVERNSLAHRWIQRRSTPWSVTWHALETFDYDLSGEFGPWAPPPPFAGHPHWRDLPTLPAAWSQSEMLGYVDYCRELLHGALRAMTDEKAARPLPQAHRYSGQPHAWLITSLVGHTTEHAAQIRQFITVNGNAPDI